MSHIFIEESHGTSKKSLSNAIASAIQAGVKQHHFDGDHICSISIVIDGYEKIGEEFHVKLRVIIFDHELAREDYYKEIEKYSHAQHEKEDLMNHYYAASLHATETQLQSREFFDHMKHTLEDQMHFVHLDHIEMIAPEHVHMVIAKELGYESGWQPILSAHIDLSGPSLGPGNNEGQADKAA